MLGSIKQKNSEDGGCGCRPGFLGTHRPDDLSDFDAPGTHASSATDLTRVIRIVFREGGGVSRVVYSDFPEEVDEPDKEFATDGKMGGRHEAEDVTHGV